MLREVQELQEEARKRAANPSGANSFFLLRGKAVHKL